MNLQDLSTTGIIGAIIAALFIIGFIKGLIRTAINLVCLTAAGYAAILANEHAHDLTAPWIANPGPWMPTIVAVSTGVLVFLLARYILHFIIHPFSHSKTSKKWGSGLPSAILTLIFGLGIIWVAITAIRYAGALAELRYTRNFILLAEKGKSSPPPPLS